LFRGAALLRRISLSLAKRVVHLSKRMRRSLFLLAHAAAVCDIPPVCDVNKTTSQCGHTFTGCNVCDSCCNWGGKTNCPGCLQANKGCVSYECSDEGETCQPVEGDSGKYANPSECEAACKPTPKVYTCTFPDLQCVEAPSGKYPSQSACKKECVQPTNTFRVQMAGDGGGTACADGKERWESCSLPQPLLPGDNVTIFTGSTPGEYSQAHACYKDHLPPNTALTLNCSLSRIGELKLVRRGHPDPTYHVPYDFWAEGPSVTSGCSSIGIAQNHSEEACYMECCFPPPWQPPSSAVSGITWKWDQDPCQPGSRTQFWKPSNTEGTLGPLAFGAKAVAISAFCKPDPELVSRWHTTIVCAMSDTGALSAHVGEGVDASSGQMDDDSSGNGVYSGCSTAISYERPAGHTARCCFPPTHPGPGGS
jgi:hypothetical protein